MEHHAVRVTVRNTAQDTVRNTAQNTAQNTVQNTAQNTAQNTVQNTAWLVRRARALMAVMPTMTLPPVSLILTRGGVLPKR